MTGPENTADELTVERVEEQIREAANLHSSLTERLRHTEQSSNTNRTSATTTG
ncbi:hypothetical protein [Nesterenkonia salmonea]|uniref:hypothetical protein n=1 Tax=Nesterenkonia salmonea TaxID=1804987 RepID=UPI00140B9571|nr:hypothetical protein [Nesterenkonia salmonea]